MRFESRRGRPDGQDIQDRLWAAREEPGSRFANRPGFAILRGERGIDPSGHDGDTGDALARVCTAFGEEPAADASLGTPTVLDATYGRGAAGWTAVLEWTLTAAGVVGVGVVGNLATDGLRAAAGRFAAYRRQLVERDADHLVNRAGAALVALDDLLQTVAEDRTLWIEAAEEIGTVAGRPLSETNHVGADPWLVLLVDVTAGVRHVRIVAPDGVVIGRSDVALGEIEQLYLPVPER